MMTNDDYQHFVCIVAGDNPDKLMAKFDSKTKLIPYVVCKYDDLNKLKNKYIAEYKRRLEYCDSDFERAYITDSICDLEEMSVNDFVLSLTEDNNEYFINNETGDLMSDSNSDGRWSYYQLGKAFSIPFLTIDGREVFQAQKKDIDWGKIHLSGQKVYERVWEMVMENSNPNDEHEEVLFNNMKDKQAYFNKFETKENYVVSNTAFWGYAFLSEKIGWMDAEDVDDQFNWMSNFYDVFIKTLPDDTLLTIYECKK